MLATPSTHWPRILVFWLCGIFAAMQFSKISFAFEALQYGYGVTPAKMGLILSTVGMMGLVFGVFIPQHAGRDRTWLSVALPLMGTGGAFCAGWLAQYWLSPLQLLRISFCGVGLAGLGVWLCSSMGTGIAPA